MLHEIRYKQLCPFLTILASLHLTWTYVVQRLGDQVVSMKQKRWKFLEHDHFISGLTPYWGCLSRWMHWPIPMRLKT